MKVLHVNINYPIRPLHQELVRALEKEKCNNVVFAPTYDSQICKFNLDENVILSECFKKRDRLFFFRKQQKILQACVKEVAFGDIDVVHAHTLFTDGNIAFKLNKFYGKPYIVTIRNTDINIFLKYKPWLIPLGLKILLNSKKVVFLSEAYKQKVIASYVPKKYKNNILAKSIIVPNGIDKYWLDNVKTHKREMSSDEIGLLSVCEIDKNKNIEETIEAMNILKDRGVKCSLTVIGRVKDDKILKMISKKDRVYYIPPMPKQKLIDYYNNLDIFVMPSHTESFGLVYAEALSQGLPIIYTRGQGFDGQFSEGEVGFAVSDEDASELADVIIKVYENYSQLSDNAIKGCRKFSWELIAKEYGRVYGELL